MNVQPLHKGMRFGIDPTSGFPLLEELCIATTSFSYLTDRDLRDILFDSPKLRVLDLRGCSRITASGLADLPCLGMFVRKLMLFALCHQYRAAQFGFFRMNLWWPGSRSQDSLVQFVHKMCLNYLKASHFKTISNIYLLNFTVLYLAELECLFWGQYFSSHVGLSSLKKGLHTLTQKWSRTLQQLDIAHQLFTEEDLELAMSYLCQAEADTLRSLNLSGTRITPRALR